MADTSSSQQSFHTEAHCRNWSDLACIEVNTGEAISVLTVLAEDRTRIPYFHSISICRLISFPVDLGIWSGFNSILQWFALIRSYMAFHQEQKSYGDLPGTS